MQCLTLHCFAFGCLLCSLLSRCTQSRLRCGMTSSWSSLCTCIVFCLFVHLFVCLLGFVAFASTSKLSEMQPHSLLNSLTLYDICCIVLTMEQRTSPSRHGSGVDLPKCSVAVLIQVRLSVKHWNCVAWTLKIALRLAFQHWHCGIGIELWYLKLTLGSLLSGFWLVALPLVGLLLLWRCRVAFGVWRLAFGVWRLGFCIGIAVPTELALAKLKFCISKHSCLCWTGVW